MSDDDLLERFLLAVEKVRAERRALGAEERAAIAREIGLTESDLAAARQRGERCLAQAEGFTRNKLWDDARHALEQAEALLPDDLRVVAAMAGAHRGRFLEQHDDADRQRVRALAARCLELDPRYEPAFEWIREVDASVGADRRKRRTWLVLGGGVSVLAAAGYAGFSALPERVAVPPEPSPTAATDSGVAPACEGNSEYCTVDSSVEVTAGAAGDTSLELLPAKLEVSPGGVKFVVAGRVTHRGATELGSLALTTVLLDAAGAEVGRQPLVAHPYFSPPLRAGESDVFHLSVDVPAATRSARLEAGKSEIQPGATSYGNVGEYVVTFEPPQPAHFKIGAVKRSYHSRRLGEKTSLETIVAFENRGEGVIRSLELEVRALGKDRKVVETRSETLVYSHMPPMRPGERRIKKLTLYADGDPVTEAVVVTKIE